MWIRTQNKQRIINPIQIIDVFVDKTGTKIMAETTRDGDFFELGCYENRQVCLDILEYLSVIIGSSVPVLTMPPLGEDIEAWKKDVITLATSSVIKDFSR